MTEVSVSSRDDLKGDVTIGTRRSDLIYATLADDDQPDAVAKLEDWLVDEKTLLANVEGVENLFAGRVVAKTEKAFLFTTAIETDDPDADQPGTDWIPKSCVRVYRRDDDLEPLAEAAGGSTLDDF